MKQTFKETYNKPWFAFLCGGLLGVIVFVLFYGVGVLEPTYVEWIFNNQFESDISQHYFGWVFFRNGEWMWPLGMTDALSYPLTSSVIFTDSIPHWALFFKLLSPLLPETFQYFGWFGILCFFMQGAMGAMIVKELTGNTTYAIVASLFFIFATPLFRRMFIHTALGAQWLILLSLYLYFSLEKLSFKKSLLLWTLTTWMAAGTHIIILTICCIILFFSAIRSVKKYRWWPSTMLLAVPALVAVLTMYILGGLSSETNPVGSTNDGGGLGWYGVNVNMLINPIEDKNSTFLPALPISDRSSDDGYSYLGLGLILMAICAIIFQTVRWFKEKRRITWGPWVWTVVMVVCLYVFAASPRVTCGSRVLFEYHPPKPILFVWEVFRCTGRFFWPIYYLAVIGIVVGFWHLWRNKAVCCMLVGFALCIQALDIVPAMKHTASDTVSLKCELRELSDEWDDLFSKNSHLCILKSEDPNFIMEYYLMTHPELLSVASRHHVKINTFYFAHSGPTYQNKIRQFAEASVTKCKADVVYLFCDHQDVMLDACGTKLTVRDIDGYLVGTKF